MQHRSIIPLLAVLGCVASDGNAQVVNGSPPIATDYVVTALPMHEVYGINDSGVAVGGADLNRQAVAYSQGQLIRLSAQGYVSAVATAISNAGHIVGYGDTGTERHGLFWQSVTSEPVRIAGLIGNIRPSSVNSQGVVVGWRSVDDGESKAFRWSITTGMTSIEPLGSTASSPRRISETGYIIGSVWFGGPGNIARWNPDGTSGVVDWSATPWHVTNDGGAIGTNSLGHPVFWSVSNTPTWIGGYTVTDMSATGRLVGESYGSTTAPRATTQVTPTAANHFYLPQFPESDSSRATDVNACGTIVGWVGMPMSRKQPVIWTRATCDVHTTATVPDVRSYATDQAAAELRRANVFAGRARYITGSCSDLNRVVGQSPASGTRVPTTTSVELSVVINCSVAVPGVRGQTISGASATLQSVGLVLGQVKTAVDNSCNYIGAVMSQTPSSGSLNWGSAVNVTIGQRPRTACP